MELIPIFVLAGVFSGLLSGLLGIGGGVVTVPILYYVLGWKGYSPAEIMQTAVATSLASIIISTSLSTWQHYKRKAVLLSVLAFLVPGLVIGCISGAQLVYLLPAKMLRIIFGVAVFFFGIYFSFPNVNIPKIADKPNPLLLFFGLVIGNLSSLLGIGGGIFTIPLLYSFGIPHRNIIATSSASTLATSCVGTLTYLIMAAELPGNHILGFIDVPAFLAISFGSVFSIRYGVKLAHHLPAPIIKRIFALILCATGIAMILR